MLITRFEDLTPWQRARELNRILYGITQRPPYADDPLCRDIRHSMVSIVSSIAAGFDLRATPRGRLRMRQALAACNGLRWQIATANHHGCFYAIELEELDHRLLEIRYLIHNLIDMLWPD